MVQIFSQSTEMSDYNNNLNFEDRFQNKIEIH